MASSTDLHHSRRDRRTSPTSAKSSPDTSARPHLREQRERSRSPDRRSNHRSHHRSRHHSRSPSQTPARSRSRSRSPARRHRHEHRHRHRSSSPHRRSHRDHRSRRHRSRSRSHSRSKRDSLGSASAANQSRRKPLPSQEQSYQQELGHGGDDAEPAPPKEKPNYKATGLLAAESNKVTVHGSTKAIVLKYHEPPEARKPPAAQPWTLYVFKGSSPEPLNTIPLHARSCWLFGREAAVADVLVEHPSTSKQHAILQFRYVVKTDEWGEKKGSVRLYVLDLESANGTRLNGERIDAARYVECKSGDVLRLGDSERDYVLLLPPKE